MSTVTSMRANDVGLRVRRAAVPVRYQLRDISVELVMPVRLPVSAPPSGPCRYISAHCVRRTDCGCLAGVQRGRRSGAVEPQLMAPAVCLRTQPDTATLCAVANAIKSPVAATVTLPSVMSTAARRELRHVLLQQ